MLKFATETNRRSVICIAVTWAWFVKRRRIDFTSFSFFPQENCSLLFILVRPSFNKNNIYSREISLKRINKCETYMIKNYFFNN